MLSLLAIGASAWDSEVHGILYNPPTFVRDTVRNVPQTFDIDQKPSEECKECVVKGATWMVDHVMARITQWCNKDAEVNQDHKEQFCKLLKEKPKIVEGMVIFWTHPCAVAGAYCYGHGDCANATSTEAMTTVEEDMRFGIDHVMDHIDISDHHESVHNDEFMASKDQDTHSECMEKVSEKVMAHTIKKIHDFCESTKFPKAKAICLWAETHKDIAFGFILAAVEPWKFAAGYCWPHPHHQKFSPIFV